MYYYKFNLKDYVNTTHCLFKYYDVKIKTEKIALIELLNSLDICRATYRKAKLLEQKAGIIILDKLNKHFETKLVSIEEVLYYENKLSEIFSKVYFRKLNDIEKLYTELERLISLDNYFKPIFMLFSIFLKTTNINSGYLELKKELNDDYNYLKDYYNFFSSELKAIFALIDIFLTTDKINDFKYFDIINTNKFILGNYHFIISTKALITKDYTTAIIYLNKGIEIYNKDNNFNRIITSINNLCITYNSLELYIMSYNVLQNYLVSVYYNDDVLFQVLKIQYYQTLFMLSLENEMVNFYTMNDNKDINDYFYLSLFYYKNTRLEDFKELFNEIVDTSNYQYPILKFLYSNLDNKVRIPKELYLGYTDILIRILESI